MNEKRIKILHVITSTVGGAGMHVADLTQYINAEQFDVRVAFTPGQHLDYRFYEMGVDVLALEMGRNINIFGMWRDFRRIYRYIKQNEIDIVHTHNTLAGIIGRLAAKIAGAPVTIHMLHTFAATPTASQLKRKVFIQLERILDATTTYYIAGSEYIRQKAISLRIANDEKIQTIYYAVNTDYFLKTDTSLAYVTFRRQELGLKKDDYVIGFIGRLEEQKAPDVFVEALYRIFEVKSNVKALIIGDGHLRKSLVDRCQQLEIIGDVQFLGWRQDIPELISIFDVFCLPSRWEAFGIVFAEAGIMGVPTVATNIEGIPEVVVDGMSGILVDVDSPEQVANALLKICDDQDLSMMMSRYGKEFVRQNFTISTMVKQHEIIYLKLHTAYK